MPNPFDKLATPPKQEDKSKEQLAQLAAAAVKDSEGFKDLKETDVKSVDVQELDLKDLDETTLMKYNIEAKSLRDSAMMAIRPVDSAVCFRWVYYGAGNDKGKDKVASMNVNRTKFRGFQFASVEDVDGGDAALIDAVIESDGRITAYDTVLMKISKVVLMGHYKKSLLDSLSNVDGALGKARKGAEGAVQATPEYQKAMQTHPSAKIEFFNP